MLLEWVTSTLETGLPRSVAHDPVFTAPIPEPRQPPEPRTTPRPKRPSPVDLEAQEDADTGM